jgi:branched-chain amino acid transport system ATP-binding protein
MLEIGQLQAFYGPAQALFGVDLQLQAGQLLVLQGLNGAGKSTLLKAVMGLEVSSHGQLLLGGPGPAPAQDISGWPTHRRASAGLGYVAEDRRLFGELTVLENLQVAGGRDSASRLDWVLERFGLLKPMLKRPAALMSGGEQQMLALARTLMTRPRLLLLDEPCEGISPVLVQAMVQVLLDLRREGLGLLVAEQNRELAQAADQVLELVAGTVRGRRAGAAPT